MVAPQCHALVHRVLAECPVTKARACEFRLPHGPVKTPVFMPICLGNTYHLGMRPGPEIMKKAGGLHGFMNWGRNLLTQQPKKIILLQSPQQQPILHIAQFAPNRYATDLVVCVALGCDMFDCVFPTRTAVSIPLTVPYALAP
ncbi:hypothetical protein XENTR_v10010020 [Xenopus tropicalis]|nr:hypothetical protein XENTR_v10010020 [Xenopus tropicalis]